jgi:hypothetical protein
MSKFKEVENLMFEMIIRSELNYNRGQAVANIMHSIDASNGEIKELEKSSDCLLSEIQTLREKSAKDAQKLKTEPLEDQGILLYSIISKANLPFILGKIVEQAIGANIEATNEMKKIYLDNIIELAQRQLLAMQGDYDFQDIFE